MLRKRSVVLGVIVAGVLILLTVGAVAAQTNLSPIEELGKSIFFDEELSLNGNQSCATCHAPEAGFAGGASDAAAFFNAHGAVYEGSVPGAFGDRKPPSAAYATLSPIFHMDKKGTFVGGNFWDGRATGEKLGNPAADQAQGPFLNPVEQALPDAATVVERVCAADYPITLEDVWGANACDDPSAAYDQIALSIAAYEASPEVNAFTSQFDLKGKLTKEEQRGKALFNGKGGCAACHPSNGKDPLFTDFTFDNLGVPANPENPVYDTNPDFVDPGLGGFLEAAGYDEEVYEEEWGKHKVPTLRNVDLRPSESFVKAYMHNGYFKTLEGVVHFYNTRDVLPPCDNDGAFGIYTEAEALAANCWPAPEVADNVNTAELGDLGLTPEEEAAIVAFLTTLSDGWEG
jgi:cytochrome c peroxidase